MVKFIFSTIFSTCKNNAVVPSLHVLYQSFFPHKYQLGAQILDLSIVFMAGSFHLKWAKLPKLFRLTIYNLYENLMVCL